MADATKIGVADATKMGVANARVANATQPSRGGKSNFTPPFLLTRLFDWWVGAGTGVTRPATQQV